MHLVLYTKVRPTSNAARCTYAIAIFHQCLIVAADGSEEQHDLNIVEDMDPLLSL